LLLIRLKNRALLSSLSGTPGKLCSIVHRTIAHSDRTMLGISKTSSPGVPIIPNTSNPNMVIATIPTNITNGLNRLPATAIDLNRSIIPVRYWQLTFELNSESELSGHLIYAVKTPFLKTHV